MWKEIFIVGNRITLQGAILDCLEATVQDHPFFSLQTQPARDVPGTSPKGRNVRDLQGTFRGLLRDQQKKL